MPGWGIGLQSGKHTLCWWVAGFLIGPLERLILDEMQGEEAGCDYRRVSHRKTSIIPKEKLIRVN